MALTRDTLKKQTKRLTRKGTVTLQDGTTEEFHVLRLTTKERGQYEGLFQGDSPATKKRRLQVREYLVVFALVDESGNRLYPVDVDTIQQSVDELAGLDGVVVESIVEAATAFNEVTKDELESLAGNFEQTRTDPSPTN